MRLLPPGECRALRAKAHHLHPVVTIGQHGLTAAVLREINVNLLAHELIKVRVFSSERGQRELMFARICDELDAAPVQHIGKLFVLWRPAPEEPPKLPPRRAARQGDGRGTAKGRRVVPRTAFKAKTMAKSTPQARRPRTPLARKPARPPAPRSRTGTATTKSGSASGRRRRGGT